MKDRIVSRQMLAASNQGYSVRPFGQKAFCVYNVRTGELVCATLYLRGARHIAQTLHDLETHCGVLAMQLAMQAA